jgi:hypothetical protein
MENIHRRPHVYGGVAPEGEPLKKRRKELARIVGGTNPSQTLVNLGLKRVLQLRGERNK